MVSVCDSSSLLSMFCKFCVLCHWDVLGSTVVFQRLSGKVFAFRGQRGGGKRSAKERDEESEVKDGLSCVLFLFRDRVPQRLVSSGKRSRGGVSKDKDARSCVVCCGRACGADRSLRTEAIK